jgi:hypothetical protein
MWEVARGRRARPAYRLRLVGIEPNLEPRLGRWDWVRPGPLLAALVVLALALTAQTAAGLTLGLVGAALGLLGGLAALQLGMLGGALAAGARVHDVVIGIGPRWAEWVSPRRTVALHGLPVLLCVGVGPGREPLRLRMWTAALCSAASGMTVVVVLGYGASSSLGRGAALGAFGGVLYALLPRQHAAPASTGWLLFELPRLPAPQRAELQAGALADQARSAVNAGDLGGAGAALAQLTTRFPAATATAATRLALLEAQGRYAEALSSVLTLAAAPPPTDRDTAFLLAGVAGLAATGVEAGQVPADAALPLAQQALLDAVRLGYPSVKLDGTRAVLALLDGDSATAARLARASAASGEHLISRADDLATLARALMAGGDCRAAKAALARAETLAPWWPRVAATRAHLPV